MLVLASVSEDLIRTLLKNSEASFLLLLYHLSWQLRTATPTQNQDRPCTRVKTCAGSVPWRNVNMGWWWCQSRPGPFPLATCRSLLGKSRVPGDVDLRKMLQKNRCSVPHRKINTQEKHFASSFFIHHHVVLREGIIFHFQLIYCEDFYLPALVTLWLCRTCVWLPLFVRSPCTHSYQNLSYFFTGPLWCKHSRSVNEMSGFIPSFSSISFPDPLI